MTKPVKSIIVEAVGYADVSGRNLRGLKESARERAEAARHPQRLWQPIADELWRKNPKLTKSEAAEEIARRLHLPRERVTRIRHVIKKPQK